MLIFADVSCDRLANPCTRTTQMLKQMPDLNDLTGG